ncbi:MAG: helix-turn-helix transcriptional regulator [Verrucomicrobia bacterium]|nr:helix-turn-helix transcriptional regulator [Verrucomicrobiota bacterium]
MRSHLDRVEDWAVLARAAHYRVGELAKLARCSRRGLECFFADRFKKSPWQWLDGLRAEESLRLLLSGCSLKATAGTLGFSDASYLCKKVKGWHGACPLRLRRERQNLRVAAKDGRPAEARITVQLANTRRR